MITVEDALKDLEELEKDATVEGKVLIKVSKVLIKFLSTMRSNQLLTEGEKAEISKAKKDRAAKKAVSK
jgi:hypothetical protein